MYTCMYMKYFFKPYMMSRTQLNNIITFHFVHDICKYLIKSKHLIKNPEKFYFI